MYSTFGRKCTWGILKEFFLSGQCKTISEEPQCDECCFELLMDYLILQSAAVSSVVPAAKPFGYALWRIVGNSSWWYCPIGGFCSVRARLSLVLATVTISAR